jgi:hypothetical protein
MEAKDSFLPKKKGKREESYTVPQPSSLGTLKPTVVTLVLTWIIGTREDFQT